jgi:hypothetical protein
MPSAIRVFQIYYDEATRACLDPGFEPLDNRANERPDWFEYWPMRQFFQREALDEKTYYGFFSTQFHTKTGLTGAQVREFIAQADGADVVTFSPYPCHGATFYNVFEQGENCHPGFVDVARQFIGTLDPTIRLEHVVNDSRNTVYCNYFAARPSYWGHWRRAFEALFGHAEDRASPLHAVLSGLAEYGKSVQMKIFVMERMASLLLALGAFVTRNYPPFSLPLSVPFLGRLSEVVALDALKIAYADTRNPDFLRAYVAARDKLAAVAWFDKPA